MLTEPIVATAMAYTARKGDPAMPKILTTNAIEQYRRDGYFSPLTVLSK